MLRFALGAASAGASRRRRVSKSELDEAVGVPSVLNSPGSLPRGVCRGRAKEARLRRSLVGSLS